MKIFINKNILLFLIVSIQSIKIVKASSDCEIFKKIHSSVGNIFGENIKNCCEYPGILCDNKQNIIKINLNNKSIKTEIPSEIGKLNKLEELDLSNNYFKGKIPQELSSLKNLRILNLNHNNLEGEIPYDLKNLVNLEEVKFNDNEKLTGCTPIFLNNIKCDYSSTKLCHLKGFCEGNVRECEEVDIIPSKKMNTIPLLKNKDTDGENDDFNESNDINDNNNNTNHNNNFDDDNKESSSLSNIIKIIAFISIGVASLTIIIALLLYFFVLRKNKKEDNSSNNNTCDREIPNSNSICSIDITEKENFNYDTNNSNSFQGSRNVSSYSQSFIQNTNTEEAPVIQPAVPLGSTSVQSVASTASPIIPQIIATTSSPEFSLDRISSLDILPDFTTEPLVIQPALPVVSPVLSPGFSVYSSSL